MTEDQAKILALEEKVVRLENLISVLFVKAERATELEAENALLKKRVAHLEEEVEHLRHTKNSRNSSIPPSKDENRPLKTKSLRPKGDKKVGGQEGHQGSTLQMVDNPDIINEHKPCQCEHCGKSLEDLPFETISRHQIIDLPPLSAQYTEERIMGCTCSCGHHNTATPVAGINAPVQFGPNIEACVVYMHSRQYMSIQRISEYFSDVFHLSISTGTICNIIERFAQKANVTYQSIANELVNSSVVGSDETGAKVNGKKGWFWTWQNNLATYIVYSANRGLDTIKENFSLGFTKAVLVHDCWKSHFDTPAITHQMCVAHLLRELTYLEEAHYNDWPTKFKDLLYDALELKHILDKNQDYQTNCQRTDLENRFIELLEIKIPEKLKDIAVFQKRMIKYREYLFPFLYFPDVPPDNNGSERAIRNIKVKQKVSGQFRTSEGAKAYAIIRSIIDTCIKRDLNILTTLHDIALS